jgi:hypothetical protein
VKTTWKIIKDTTGKIQSPDTNVEINSGDDLLTDVNEIADTFNSYFVNIAEDLNREIIKYLKNNNSSGCDELSNNILKYCVNEISKPLTFIFNYSLATGIYPDRFKYVVVWPIHNKGDKLQKTNCRPISLLISCSKILETIMFNRLYQFM